MHPAESNIMGLDTYYHQRHRASYETTFRGVKRYFRVFIFTIRQTQLYFQRTQIISSDKQCSYTKRHGYSRHESVDIENDEEHHSVNIVAGKLHVRGTADETRKYTYRL